MCFFSESTLLQKQYNKSINKQQKQHQPRRKNKKGGGKKKPPMEALAAASVDRALETINFERKKLSISALLATP